MFLPSLQDSLKSAAVRLALLAALSASGVCAQVTTAAFTYQGKVTVSGSPANGNYDFEFKLFDEPTSGAQKGSTVTLTGIAVTNGVFTVQLDFGASVFDGTDRYLEIGVQAAGGGGFTTLTPRQLITKAPYALHTIDAETLGGVAASEYLQNSAAPQPNVNLNIGGDGTIGGTMSANMVNTTVEYQMNGSHILSADSLNNTFIGIGAGGTTSPSRKRPTIPTGGNNTLDGANAGVSITTGNENSFVGSGAGQANTTGNANSFFGAGAGFSNQGGLSTGAENSFFGRHAGFANTLGYQNVFIGANTAPQNSTGFRNTYIGFGAGYSTISGNSNTLIGAFTGSASADPNLVNSTAVGAYAAVEQNNSIVLGGIAGINGAAANTNVGVGTTMPVRPLHIKGTGEVAMRLEGDANSTSTQIDTAIAGVRRWTFGVTGNNHQTPNAFFVYQDKDRLNNSVTTTRVLISDDGKVGIGTTSPQALLHVAGTSRTGVLEITGGSDLAEHFEVVEDAKPGMLVAIDPRNTGKLTIARGAYNRRVAGVVSGANHLSAGMVLPDASGAKKSMAVALSGRVWVYCDATKQTITPGDLLTTSDNAGHAMKVTNHRRAQGAIIGKAMTGLKCGKGFVLVLVSLQ